VTLAEKQQQLIEDFAVIYDPDERLSLAIDRVKKRPPLAAIHRIDANRVHGCVSVVWLVSELRDGRCHFQAEAESPVVRGLIGLLCDFFSGATPSEIVASDADPLEALGLTRHLSPTRRNGLAATRAAIRAFAAKNST